MIFEGSGADFVSAFKERIHHIFTFFIGTLKEVWVSGNWGELVSFKVFFSVGLFIFSFFIPKIIKKFKSEDTST